MSAGCVIFELIFLKKFNFYIKNNTNLKESIIPQRLYKLLKSYILLLYYIIF